MPPSTRRSGQKRATDHSSRTNLNVPDSSPSRAKNKRRKANGVASRPPPPTSEDELAQNEDSTDETSSEAEVQTVADLVIPHLAVARALVTVATKHDNNRLNEGQSNIQAYAKVCGRGWTYYVQDLQVFIGRPPDSMSHHSYGLPVESSPAPQESTSVVHIDLGPSKIVSRSHAELFYEMADSKWYINVKGRNGLRINREDFQVDMKIAISSGDVVEIAGTEMMFITAQGKAVIHPIFMNKARMFVTGELPMESAEISHGHGHPEYPPHSDPRLPSSQAHAAPNLPANGQAATVPTSGVLRPATPEQSPKKAPRPSSAAKQSPAYGRGIVLESAQHIDYASDATKDLKPAVGYAIMITQAILSTKEEHIALSGIYKWIRDHFSFYRHLTTNWQNSIRHNLSLNPGFEKVPRKSNEPGKGSNWRIKDEKREELINNVQKAAKKGYVRASSVPGSPANRDEPLERATIATEALSSENNAVKAYSIAGSPPRLPRPTTQESTTPSRVTTFGNGESPSNLPTLWGDDPSPTQSQRQVARTYGPGSSPLLNTGIYRHSPFMTPLPRQHNLRAPLPNTAKLPTSHMADSSPAPFWRYGQDVASTPAQWPVESSPLKRVDLPSSSPVPSLANGNESPSRGRGGPQVQSTGESDADEDGAIDILK
ncbi:MAG: hypothetical protein LQ342_001124 [Letrouitia transgressa]|nr:MAG: hypothetical protein LQ342_001124 [Letrouitia transgressa]